MSVLPVGARLVPRRGEAEDGDGVAAAEGAHHQVVHLRRVLHHRQLRRGRLVRGRHPELGDGGRRVVQEARLVKVALQIESYNLVNRVLTLKPGSVQALATI